MVIATNNNSNSSNNNKKSIELTVLCCYSSLTLHLRPAQDEINKRNQL